MQPTSASPQPEKSESLIELFEARLEQAAQKAKRLLAGDRLRRQHRQNEHGPPIDPRPEILSNASALETQSKDACD